MPLTAGRRDETNERFKNTLQKLVSLTFVPQHFPAIDAELEKLGLSLEKLAEIDSDELLEDIGKQNMDFENAELFADFLSRGFPALAVAVYRYIQQNNKVYSFGIADKITALAS